MTDTKEKTLTPPIPESTINLDANTISIFTDIIKTANAQIDTIKKQMNERLGLLITIYVNAKNKKGAYMISEDLTQLILQTPIEPPLPNPNSQKGK